MANNGFQLIPLKGEKRFSEMFAKGKRFSSKKIMLTLEFREVDFEGQELVEFAVVVGKRTAKSAVIRNRIKRLLRESMRMYYSAVFGEYQSQPIKTLVINWRFAPKHAMLIGLKEVSSELLYILRKVKNSINELPAKQEKL